MDSISPLSQIAIDPSAAPSAATLEHDGAVKQIIADFERAAAKRDFGVLGAVIGRVVELSLAPNVTHLRRSQFSSLYDAMYAAYLAFYSIMLDASQQALLTNGINGVGTLTLIWTGRSKQWQPHLPCATAARDFALVLQLQCLAWAVADRIRSRQNQQQAGRDAVIANLLNSATEATSDDLSDDATG